MYKILGKEINIKRALNKNKNGLNGFITYFCSHFIDLLDKFSLLLSQELFSIFLYDL